MKIKDSVYMFCVAILLGLVSSGCVSSTTGSGARMDEESLRKRVEMEWNARVSNSWGTIYDLTTEAFRKGRSREIFGIKANIKPSSYTIRQITVNPADKTGDVEVDFIITQLSFNFPSKYKERWIWENGDWYLDFK